MFFKFFRIDTLYKPRSSTYHVHVVCPFKVSIQTVQTRSGFSIVRENRCRRENK